MGCCGTLSCCGWVMRKDVLKGRIVIHDIQNSPFGEKEREGLVNAVRERETHKKREGLFVCLY